MNEWQKQFAQKLDVVRSATRERFERAAEIAVVPVFKEFGEFTNRFHVRATAPLTKPGVRTYKFSMTENTYILITFRHTGLQCEGQAEYVVPGRARVSPMTQVTDLSDMDPAWCRRMIEQALDRFLETITDSLGETAKATEELVAV